MSAPRIALDDPASFAAGHPHDQYRYLRENHPVYWHPETDGSGFWAVTSYPLVVQVSRNTATYSSWLGGVMLPDSDPALLEGSRLMMLFQDPPGHTRYRRLVSRAFTPRAAADWKERIDRLAVRIVDAVADRDECDFVADVAGEMPSLVIADLMGIPSDDGRRLYHLTEIMHSSDPDLTEADGVAAIMEMHAYASETAARKRREPADDLATALVTARVDGESLSDEEFNWFFLLLVNAGGDTTRNLVAGGIEALLDAPDQMAAIRQDPGSTMATTVEEMLRYVSPVVHMRRTATVDTELGGQRIAAGDKVVVFYAAANRDPSIFADGESLDVRRRTNHHLAFGGGGAHMCLGAHFARLETAALMEQVVTRMDDLRMSGPVERLHSTFIAGPKHLPVSYQAS
ncbi:MAG TPA: cytochrome P450 [Acidimicrobiales bacterium]|jgi:cytochrome P450|nr:cytochrome P450 [Acidimicrobiales bacterium]